MNKRYYIALSEPANPKILGGGWSEADALDDAAVNAPSETVHELVLVDKALGKTVEDEGDAAGLAAECYARALVRDVLEIGL